MNWLLFFIGAALVVTAWVEEIWTTLWIDGHAAPLTRTHTTLTYKLVRRLARYRYHRLLSTSGPLVLVGTVLFWSLLLWAGFALMFAAQPTALVHAHTGATASWQERVYFVGYSVFTFGNGDFSPQGTFWQWLAALAGMSGLVLVSLTVTYLLSVLGAAVFIRSFAGQVHALGANAEDFVVNAWEGVSFRAVELQLISLTERVSSITERLAAYPLIHFYHAHEGRQSLSVGLAILDDALLLFMRAVAREARPAPAILRTARTTVWILLQSARREHITKSENAPIPPSLARLRAAGIPVVSDAEFADGIAKETERRQLLRGLAELETHRWPSAVASPTS